MSKTSFSGSHFDPTTSPVSNPLPDEQYIGGVPVDTATTEYEPFKYFLGSKFGGGKFLGGLSDTSATAGTSTPSAITGITAAFGGLIPYTSTNSSRVIPDFGITKNRRTRVYLYPPRYDIVESPYFVERQASEIGRDVANNRDANKVMLIDQVGWVVKNLWEDLSLEVERTEVSTSLGTADVTMPAIYTLIDEWKKPPTSMVDILTGASTSIAATGSSKFRKRVGASTSWNQTITDVYTFPNTYQSTLVNDNSLAMDKVLITNTNDAKDGDLLFRFWTPGATSDTPQLLYQLGFCGPASAPLGPVVDTSGSTTKSKLRGMGQYCLNIYGNGMCELFERLYDDLAGGDPQLQYKWTSRITFRYADNSKVEKEQWIKIYKFVLGASTDGICGKLIFVSKEGAAEAVTDIAGGQGISKVGQLKAIDGAGNPTYNAPSLSDTDDCSTYLTGIRLSVRRDIRGSFNILRAAKPTSATIVDDPISLPISPYASGWTSTMAHMGEFTVAWGATLPSGAGIDVKMYRCDTGAELPTGTTSGTSFKTYRFVQPNSTAAAQTTYYAKMFFTTNGVNSPIFKGYRVYSDGRYVTSGTTAEVGLPRGVNIVGAERDPKGNNMHLMLADPYNSFTSLRTNASIPIRVTIDTDPDVSPNTARTTIFRGFTTDATATRKVRAIQGNSTTGPTAITWYDYNVQAVGMYQRLGELVNPLNMPLYNLQTGQPFKLTDVIKLLLTGAGFLSTDAGISAAAAMQDIPDLDTVLFTKGGGYHEQIDILTELGKTTLTLIDEYLGHFLIFDENDGDYGKWRLIAPSVAPYTVMATFGGTPDTIAGKIIPTSWRAWQNETLTTGYANSGEVIPGGFIKKNTLKSRVRRPAGNVIIASAAMKTTPNGVDKLLFQVLPNFVSADFGNGLVDPTHPDYLGRIIPVYVMLPQLQSMVASRDDESSSVTEGSYASAALNFLARRAYDIAVHAVKLVTFEAPLVLVEHENDPTKKRPLRYYDPILVEGELFLVRNVNISYRKDFHQMAVYECEAPRI